MKNKFYVYLLLRKWRSSQWRNDLLETIGSCTLWLHLPLYFRPLRARRSIKVTFYCIHNQIPIVFQSDKRIILMLLISTIFTEIRFSPSGLLTWVLKWHQPLLFLLECRPGSFSYFSATQYIECFSQSPKSRYVKIENAMRTPVL